MIRSFKEIHDLARKKGKRTLVVPSAEDKVTILSVYTAVKEGLIDGILIGKIDRIEKVLNELNIEKKYFEIIESDTPEESATRAVEMVRSGKAHFILKGYLHTHILLKAVLDSEKGLRSGKLLSDILFAKNPASEDERIVGMSDGGINILPGLKEKREIVENAVWAYHRLGFENPKVAILAAIEVVNPSMPATVDADELKKMNQKGEIKGCVVDGPLALDLAVSKEAAEKKGVKSEVAGDADILIVPNIEAGNLLGKSFTYYAKVPVGHVIVGAKAPILIPSRNESENDKLNSIALGVIFSD
ncbi:MAG: bifunctional enoyl-CoA hydratase/phosphate acetyltransferase [Candidatus Aminicenantia bacterium]